MTINTFIILFAIVTIVFNIWNTFNLSALLKRPLKVDALNDQKYWEPRSAKSPDFVVICYMSQT